MSEQFYYTLYTALLARAPKDTRNMVTHITLEDFGDHWLIKISGPMSSYRDKKTGKPRKSNLSYDYARDVNYNRQRSAKEVRNYKWIEATIKQVAKVIGGNVIYELY